MLVTFDVPVRPDAAALAVDSAVESGQQLVLVNLVELTIRPMTASWGSEVVVLDDVDASLRAPAELAHPWPSPSSGCASSALGRSRRCSSSSASARRACSCSAPTRARMRGRRYRKAARKLREEAACLVWIPAE